MFSYIMLGTNDLSRAITFYDPLMDILAYPRGGTDEGHQAYVRISAKVSTALTSEIPMATSWLSCITPHNPENDKPGASVPPPETKPIPQISEERWTS